MFSDPVAASGVGAQSILQPEENFVVRIDLNPHAALCAHIATGFLDHGAHQHLARFTGNPLPAIMQIQLSERSPLNRYFESRLSLCVTRKYSSLR